MIDGAVGTDRAPEPRVRGGRTRGFTLVELMVVVIIIAVVAALTLPNMLLRMRERRASEAAGRIAMLYQMARSEAMGRGAAVLVRYTHTTGQGAYLVREAQRGTSGGAGCQSLPSPSCQNTDWDNIGPAQFRDVTKLDLSERSEYNDVYADMFDTSGAPVTFIDVCFTPMGRSYTRLLSTGPLIQLTGIYHAEVYRQHQVAKGRIRSVVILPNGIARLQ